MPYSILINSYTTILGDNSGSYLSIFVYYLTIYLFIYLFLSILSKTSTRSRQVSISAAVVQLSLMGATTSRESL